MTSLHVFYTFTVYTSVDGSRGRGKRRRRRRRRQRRQSECEQVELSDQSKLGSCQIDSPDSDPPSTILQGKETPIYVYFARPLVFFRGKKNARWLFVVGRSREGERNGNGNKASNYLFRTDRFRRSGTPAERPGRASCGRGCQPTVTSPLAPDCRPISP